VIKVLPNDTYHVVSVPRDGGRVYSTTAHVSQLKQWRLIAEEGFDEKNSLMDEEDNVTSDEDAHIIETDNETHSVVSRGIPVKGDRRRPAYLGDYVQ